MAKRKLYWTRETNILGTNVWLGTRDKSVNEQVAANLEFDPIKRLNSKLKSGYMFRSPNVDPNRLGTVFGTLEQIAGSINIWAERDTKSEKITAYAIVEDKSDAAMFAWAQVELFQKWDEAKQAEARAEEKRKPQKVKINKDGTIRVKVTQTILEGDEDETGL